MKREKKRRSRGLLQRWVTHVVMVIAAVTFLIAAGGVVFFGANSYNALRLLLSSQDNEHAAAFLSGRIREGADFPAAAAAYVNGFAGRDRMELWLVDGQGGVAASSGGFGIPADTPMPDVFEALASESGQAFWRGRCYGEPVMAFAYRLRLPGMESCALRRVVSLREVHLQLAQVAGFILLLWVGVLGMITLPGRFFIGSLLKPLGHIGEVTSRIARGDYEARAELNRWKDEIARLSEDVNHMAEEIQLAEQTKLDFISTISHELRTPLTAIQGWGETLLGSGADDPALTRRGLGIIKDEASRLTSLVEELLDFSRLQSNRMVMREERMDILAELDDAIFIFRERAARTGVELACTSSDDPAPMLGDPARIRQVFVNVLDNAFKYTPQGGKVTVSITFDPPPSPLPAQPVPQQPPKKLCVTIADTGCGVSERDLPRITEKFYKTSTNTKGSGIGLAVVAEILKKHGCTLSLESAPGMGMTVEIIFPLLYKNS
ncbi:MAG: HAMP domain-containing histidine kinase [Oscillospiraceae bacterium]|nr:HAMP domain-containing histidine kinase [Oscillospiraceae bacterium]